MSTTRTPDRSPDRQAWPPAPSGPAPCDRCGAPCRTLHFDRAGEGELLCGECVRVLAAEARTAAADRKPVRLTRSFPGLETK